MTRLIWSFCFALVVMGQQAIAKPLENKRSESPEYIGELLVQALTTGEYEELDARFDKTVFVEKVLTIMEPEKKVADAIRKSLINAISLETIFKNALGGVPLESITAKNLRVVHKNGGPVPIVRLNMEEGGSNYYELSLYKNRGQYFIADIFVIANGQFVSDSMAQAMGLVFNQTNGWFSGAKIKQSEMKQIGKTFIDMNEMKKKGDYEAAYKLLKTLPASLTDSDTIHLAIVMIAVNLDDATYRKELSDFAKKHGHNPRYTFMLVDHYTYTEEYDKVIKNIDTLALRYKNDASLMTLKASIYFLQKDYQAARTALEAAIKYEPDFEDAYWTTVTVAAAEEKYVDVVEWLREIEEQFSYDFAAENFQDQETYAGFIKSTAFKKWMKSKQA